MKSNQKIEGTSEYLFNIRYDATNPNFKTNSGDRTYVYVCASSSTYKHCKISDGTWSDARALTSTLKGHILRNICPTQVYN